MPNCSTRSLITDTLKLVQWHRANMEYANACPMDSLSLRFWDQDDEHARGRIVPCRSRRTCAGLARPLRTRQQWPVAKVERVNNLIVVTKENSTETLVAEVVGRHRTPRSSSEDCLNHLYQIEDASYLAIGLRCFR